MCLCIIATKNKAVPLFCLPTLALTEMDRLIHSLALHLSLFFTPYRACFGAIPDDGKTGGKKPICTFNMSRLLQPGSPRPPFDIDSRF